MVIDKNRTEPALLSSERKYRKIFENALVGFFRTDVELDRILEVNQRCAEMYGFTRPEEMVGRSTSEFFSDISDQAEIRSTVAHHKGIVRRIARMRKADGAEIVVEGTAWPGSEPGTIEGIHVEITDRIRVQEELHASEERLRKVIDHMPVMVHAHDEQGNYIYWNRECERVTGYTAREMLSNPEMKQRLYPDESYRRRIEEMHTAREDFRDMEIEMVCADGAARTISISNVSSQVPIPGWHLWETGMDITSRVRAEQELVQSEARFRKIFEEGPLGIALLSTDCRFLRANTTFCDLLGYTEREILGRTFADLTHPDDVLGNIENIKALLQGEIPQYNTEKRYLRKDGTIVWVHVTASLVRDAQGRPLYFVAMVADIRERLRAQHALRESKERFQSLVETTSDWIWEVDGDCRYTYASPRVRDLLGYDPHEVIGKTPFDLMPPEEAGRVKETFQDIMRSCKPFSNLENRNLCRDGREIVLETSGIPVRTEEGKLCGYRGVDRDITARKRLEEELLRTLKLESIGTLAGGIAHDFNNTLTMILGNITLIKTLVAGNDRAAELLLEAEEACSRATAISRRLITFSGGGAPVKESLNLCGIIRDTVELTLSGSNVRPEFTIAMDCCSMTCDSDQIGQMLAALVTNAREAMPRGGALGVSITRVELDGPNPCALPTGPYMQISMRDHGPGIPRDLLGRIFDPFFTTKAVHTGLGLSLAHSIAKRHGGWITVHSEPGAGSTFDVYLPIGQNARRGNESIEQPATFSGGKVLVMDDEPLIRTVVGRMLESLGHKAALCADGREAVRQYGDALKTGEPYDLVIVDLTVPGGMGGQETLSAIREIDPKATVVVSSGFSEDAVMADYLNAGFSGALPKPYSLHQLKKVVAEAMSRAKKHNGS
jgi:two-component system, cell cycle sensor histidine kinase and response regulator CckA